MMYQVSRRGVLAVGAAALGSGWAPGAGAVQAPAQALFPAGQGSRERLSLDKGWRFHLGHASDPERDFGFGRERNTYTKPGETGSLVSKPEFDDSGWERVDVPHDWVVGLPFARLGEPGSGLEKSMASRGFKPFGRHFPDTSVGWYRRSFDLPAADQGKRIWLEFDGVGRDSIVVVNGFFVGGSESGYAPFLIDITDFVTYGGTNLIVVRADVSLGEGWWYEGGGIYRHVWLVKAAPTHVRPWGVAVRPTVTGADARVAAVVTVDNKGPAAKLSLRSAVVDAEGRRVLALPETAVAVTEWGSTEVEQSGMLEGARLWSPEEPNLYTLVTELLADGRVVDAVSTRFGVRTIRFDPDYGFFLNGRRVEIKGVCNHHDHAGVGIAVPDALHRYRLGKIKEMGANAFRQAHNSAGAEIDLCDELGILVMGETRQMSSNAEALDQLERIVLRDRNHPSIFMWCMGNEEVHRNTAQGARIAASMKRRIYELDGTRPVTEAFNGYLGEGASPVLDVMGVNYVLDQIDPFRAKFPKQPLIGTEVASTVATRGEYFRDDKRGIVPAYDTDFPPWASTAETWWTMYAARPFLAGGFIWTGFDYRGEPTPFDRWPNHSSNFGVMDTCGFPKDNFHYYQAWWGEKPVLHLFPHWNWTGREGLTIPVWVHSNLDEVELFVNGASLGRKPVEKNRHLEWKALYRPGRIEARGYKGGRVAMTARRETTGAPTAVKLSCDRRDLNGDGEDVGVITAAIVDAKGRVVPTASDLVRFELAGPGRALGVGNGDPRCLEPDKASRRSAFNGLCSLIVGAGEEPGPLRILAEADGLRSAALTIPVRKAAIRPRS